MAMRNKEQSLSNGRSVISTTGMNSTGTQIRNIPIPSPPSLSSSSEDDSDEMSDEDDGSNAVSDFVIQRWLAIHLFRHNFVDEGASSYGDTGSIL